MPTPKYPVFVEGHGWLTYEDAIDAILKEIVLASKKSVVERVELWIKGYCIDGPNGAGTMYVQGQTVELKDLFEFLTALKNEV